MRDGAQSRQSQAPYTNAEMAVVIASSAVAARSRTEIVWSRCSLIDGRAQIPTAIPIAVVGKLTSTIGTVLESKIPLNQAMQRLAIPDIALLEKRRDRNCQPAPPSHR